MNPNEEDLVQSKKMVMGMIALNRNDLIYIKNLKKQLKDDWRAFPKINKIVSKKEALFMYLEGSELVSIANKGFPIPWCGLKGPCATAYLWPEATEIMKTHQNHYLIVFVNSSRSVIEQSILITKIMISIAKITDIVGVYWGSGTSVNSANYLLGFCEEFLQDGLLPIPLWIEFRIQKNKDGTENILTTGMDVFGYREIEVQKTHKNPFELLERLYDITVYLLNNGFVIKDGVTFGTTEKGKNKARDAPSLWDRDGVLVLDFI
ncbi:MAG: DUF4261 domain-containing protein [Promethearchaeota archaeon]